MQDVKTAVRALLMLQVEQLVGSSIPDRPLAIEVSTLSRATASWGNKYDTIAADGLKLVTALEQQDAIELQWAHRKLAAAMLRDLRSRWKYRLRQALQSRHLDAELRAWGRQQAKKFSALNRRPNGFSIAYLVLTLESAIEFELAQSPEAEITSGLDYEQRLYVDKHTLQFER